MKKEEKPHFQTLAIHGSKKEENPRGAQIAPIYQTSTFVFKNVQEVRDILSGKKKGYFYSRIKNPNQEELENLLADLEGAESALGFASGMAAISTVLRTFVSPTDHVICGQVLYGCTDELFNEVWPRFNIEFSFVDTRDIKNIKKAVRKNTKLIFIETPDNPTLSLTNIRATAGFARERRILFIADNTFATPHNQKPLNLGADLVIHSLTKYIDGHGDAVAGAVMGSENLIRKIEKEAVLSGECIIAPFNCFLIERGIKTLPMRMRTHNYNGFCLANFLERHPKVSKVFYPGLPSHPQYKLACKQMLTPLGFPGFGGMLSFELKDEQKLEGFIDYLISHSFVELAVSLGCAGTLVQIPYLMTHGKISEEEKLKKGITKGLIRVSVGIEHYKDIENAFREALDKAA